MEEHQAKIERVEAENGRLQAEIKCLTQRCEGMEKVNGRVMAETQLYERKMIEKVIAIGERYSSQKKQAKELYEVTKTFLQK